MKMLGLKRISVTVGAAFHVQTEFLNLKITTARMVHQRKLEAARELYGLSPTDEVPEELKVFCK